MHVAGAVALYVLNHKRARLAEIEARYGMEVTFAADESLLPPQTRIERVRAQTADMPYLPPPMPTLAPTPVEDDIAEEEADSEDDTPDEADTAEAADVAVPGETAEEADRRRGKRRRRRRGGRREDTATAPIGDPGADPAAVEQPDIPMMAEPAESAAVAEPAEAAAPGEAPVADGAEDDGPPRRRGRRGGRRRRREPGEGEAPAMESGGEEAASFDAPPSAPVPAYVYDGPTPANPFGGQSFDIFDMMDEAEQREASAKPSPAPEPPASMVEQRPEVQSTAAEATVPAEVEMAAEPAQPVAAASIEPEPPLAPEPTVAVAEPVSEAAPAVLEEEPPLLNGHAAETRSRASAGAGERCRAAADAGGQRIGDGEEAGLVAEVGNKTSSPCIRGRRSAQVGGGGGIPHVFSLERGPPPPSASPPPFPEGGGGLGGG